jgi:hypothetical protein
MSIDEHLIKVDEKGLLPEEWKINVTILYSADSQGSLVL